MPQCIFFSSFFHKSKVSKERDTLRHGLNPALFGVQVFEATRTQSFWNSPTEKIKVKVFVNCCWLLFVSYHLDKSH